MVNTYKCMGTKVYTHAIIPELGWFNLFIVWHNVRITSTIEGDRIGGILMVTRAFGDGIFKKRDILTQVLVLMKCANFLPLSVNSCL